MDVATLGINVELKNGQVAAQGLDNIAAAGARAEASTKKLSTTTQGLGRFQQDLVNRAREVYQAAELLDVQNKSAVKQWEKQRDMWAEIAARHKQTAIVENELAAATQLVAKNQQAATEYARRFAEAQRELTAVHGRLGPGINSVRSALTSMTASMLGAAPGVGQLTGVLGSLALGSTLMVGVLAGVAAVAAAYRLFTEDARKAAEQQKKLTDALVEWYRTKQSGGEGAQQITAATKAIADEQAEIDKLTKKLGELNNAYNAKTGLRDEAAIAATKNQIASLTAAIEEQRQAIVAKQADDAQSIASAALELEHQRALNDAFGKGAVAIARINAEYELRGKLIQNASQYAGEQLAAMNAIARATAEEQVRNAVLVEQKREMDELDKSQTKTLDDLRASLEKTNAEWTVNAQQYERIISLNAMLNEAREKAIPKIAADADKIVAEQDKKSAELLKKLKDFNDDMQTIWRDGIGKIATDGTKSFQDFFEDVFQMFSKLMDRMKKEGGKGGLLDGLKQIWNTPFTALNGIGAGAAGASTGYASGSATNGLLSGALVGGLVGGPFGAIIGGIAGLTGGLLGGSKAARERREAEDALRQSLTSSLNSLRVAVGMMSELDGAIAQVHDQASSLRAEAEKAYAGRKNEAERESILREINQLEDQRIAQLKREAEIQRGRDTLDLQGQILDAQGNTKGAAELRRQMQLWEAINGGKSPEYIALLEKLQDIQRANEAEAAAQQAQADAQQKAADEAAKQKELLTQLRDATQAMADDINRQVDAQQQTIQATQRIVDQLKQYRDSLSLNPSLSILSPGAQLAQARSSYQALLAKAMQGDQTAAGGLPDAANTFLQLSRNYNASGAGYVADFRSVQAGLGAVQDQFGAQLSTEEKMLAELQKQSAYFQKQIEVLNQQLGVSKQSAQMQYVTTLLANTKSVTDANGNVISGVNVAADAIRKLFPGLAVMVDQRSGTGFLGNADFRSPVEYYSWAYRNEEDKSNVPADIRAMLHDAGIPGYANGGAFGGGLMRVGEVGQELVATGPARVHTARDLNAPTVAAIDALREEVADLALALRAGFTQQIETTAQVGETVKTSARETARAITKAAV